MVKKKDDLTPHGSKDNNDENPVKKDDVPKIILNISENPSVPVEPPVVNLL